MTAREESAGDSEDRVDAAPDEVLARRVQGGDEDALEQLVRRYLRPIYSIAASYLTGHADIEDAAQETFLRALRGIEGYDPDRPFAPWLYQIARNVARNRLGDAVQTRTQRLSEELRSTQAGPDVALERAEIRARVDAAVARLPEQRRTAFYLADVEGYRSEEIARMMGLSPGTVRSHVHHARRALRVALAERAEQVQNPGE